VNDDGNVEVPRQCASKSDAVHTRSWPAEAELNSCNVAECSIDALDSSNVGFHRVASCPVVAAGSNLRWIRRFECTFRLIQFLAQLLDLLVQ